MHIDHSKLVELVSEASGLTKEEVEQQLQELVSEIKEAISEGDAYELEGLGVFSGIGQNIVFIPSEDLATEINYKYVGMQPIEMDSSGEDTPDSDTFAAPSDESAEEEPESEAFDGAEEDDPFAGLLGGSDDMDTEEKEEDDEIMPSKPYASFELDKEESDPEDRYADIDTDSPFDIAGSEYVDEEDGAEDELNESIEESIEEPEEESSVFDALDMDLPDADEDNSEEDTEAASPFQMDDLEEEEEQPGPEEWGIDSYKEDNSEKAFSGLFGESNDSDTSRPFSEEEETNDLSEEKEEPLEQEPIEDEENLSAALNNMTADEEEEEDFDDPFKTMDEGETAEQEEPEAEEEEKVPVITNLSSEGAKKDKKDKKMAKKENKKKTTKKPKSPRDKKKSPVMLWLILILIVMVGGTYGLGYFGVISIPGVQPGSLSLPQFSKQTQPEQQPVQPPTQQPVSQQPTQAASTQNNEPQATSAEATAAVTQKEPAQEPVAEEQAEESTVSANTNTVADPNQSRYGMMGAVIPASNDGFTIVVYSLSKESNARAKQKELQQEGYRTLVVKIPSSQYGSLWRVSIGQFESLRTAALAAEKLSSPFSENYFITKI